MAINLSAFSFEQLQEMYRREDAEKNLLREVYPIDPLLQEPIQDKIMRIANCMHILSGASAKKLFLSDPGAAVTRGKECPTCKKPVLIYFEDLSYKKLLDEKFALLKENCTLKEEVSHLKGGGAYAAINQQLSEIKTMISSAAKRTAAGSHLFHSYFSVEEYSYWVIDHPGPLPECKVSIELTCKGEAVLSKIIIKDVPVSADIPRIKILFNVSGITAQAFRRSFEWEFKEFDSEMDLEVYEKYACAFFKGTSALAVFNFFSRYIKVTPEQLSYCKSILASSAEKV